MAAIALGTDLANWGKPGFLLTDDPRLAMFIPLLGIDPKAPKSDLEALLKRLSPITLVTAEFPPTQIVHGDDDKLDVIPGGGYDDKTFCPGLMKALQWFKDKLLK